MASPMAAVCKIYIAPLILRYYVNGYHVILYCAVKEKYGIMIKIAFKSRDCFVFFFSLHNLANKNLRITVFP